MRRSRGFHNTEQGSLSPLSKAEDRLVSSKELALRWGVSEKMLAHARMSGTLVSHIQIGRKVRYKLSLVMRYEEENSCRSTAEH